MAETQREVPTAIPACGPPRSLSPEKMARSAPSLTASCTRGSLATGSQRPAAYVGDHREPQGGEIRDPYRLGEADRLEVAGVDPEDRAGVLVYGVLVVREPGTVCGADLPESGAGEGEHFGDAESAPDLDELAARDDHLGRLGAF